MIPKIYDRDNNYIGELPDCTRGLVIEERNGMFELELDYRLFHKNYEYLVRGNIIEADANDKLKGQFFRIYKVTKDILGQFSVYAKHISYDIGRDYTEGLNITNQSCEYCLNQLFRNSQFSQKFTGYSDIVNAQNYSITSMNLMSAIAGARGSILDTFGKGAEVLRDNYDFHVLNKRGHDNDVVIEYASNLTGLDYEEDDTDLVTRIRAIAKYTPPTEEGSEAEPEEQLIYTYVDSPNINKYETPFIGEVDFSEKFEEGQIPTIDKLRRLAEKYFEDNKCDLVKFNYQISFIPLSKCVGYEGIEDRIDLCDTVTIIDYRYGLNTKAKVIKSTYDFLRNRYDSMELGEPRTTLGDVVGGSSSGSDGAQGPAGPQGEQGPAGPQGPPGETTIQNFPDTLPATPVLNFKLYGFASIELSWTFESQVYYTYELYASKIKDFTPNTFDLIHEGQTSSYLFQAEPSETWYFRVCGKNTYGNRTAFSEQVEVTTKKIDDLSNYVSDMAIGDALIGELSLDRGWVGQLNASLLDVKGNFSVTDGNGKRTMDIDSFGNVYLDVAQLTINSSSVAKESYVNEQVNNATNDINNNINDINNDINDLNTSISTVQQTADKINWLVKSGTSSSNMSLTSDALNIISNNINLTGKVTFSSFGGDLQTQINGISTTANNAASTASTANSTANSAKTTANNAASTANSVSTYVNNNSDDWDAAYNTVYWWASGYPSSSSGSSNTTTINGGYIETGSIKAEAIKSNTISVDMLKANNANPIIRLFDECAIDATYLYEEGQGNAIRLKWDGENYIYIGDNNILFFLSDGNEGRVLSITGNTSEARLANQNGYTLTLGSSLSYRNSTVLTAGNYSSYCASSSHTHSGYASSSHTHSGYASSSHTHSYASSSHTHDYVPTDSSTTFWTGSHSPYSTNKYNLGWSQEKWLQVCAKDVYADYCSASDINIKENIRYIKPDNISMFNARAIEGDEIIKPNEEHNIDLGITGLDLYNFVRDELRLCEYNYTDEYIVNSERGNFENKLGFIAQDIADSKIGTLIVGEWEGQLSYNLNNYTSALGGALQYEIVYRDAQIDILTETIVDLEAKIEEIQGRENEINELKTRIELLEEMLNQK